MSVFFNSCSFGKGLAQSEVASQDMPLEQPNSRAQYLVSSAFSRKERLLPS
jgi:hypothetical protein